MSSLVTFLNVVYGIFLYVANTLAVALNSFSKFEYLLMLIRPASVSSSTFATLIDASTLIVSGSCHIAVGV